MNYSHYLTYPFQREAKTFMLFIQDARDIIENAPENAELCGPDDTTEPLINNSVLVIGSKTNQSPFSLLKILADEPWPDHRYPILSVRTDKHGYDPVICACLLAFRHHFPASSITTDGTSKDWVMGIALYEYATQRLAPSNGIPQ